MGALLGIVSFLTSPIGRWVGIAGIGALLFFAGEFRGRRIANEKCEAAAAAARQAADKQDEKARTEVSQQSETTLNELRGQKEKSDARIAELENELRLRPLDAPCLYGADGKPATPRLRQPSTAPRTGNPPASRPAGVPPAGRKAAGDRGG